MKRLACLLPLLAASAAAPARADDAPFPAASVRVTSALEHLSNGTPDWRENDLGVQLAFKPHEVLDLSAGETRRFGLRDDRFGAAFTLPLSPTLAASVEADASTTHQVLARHAFGAGLQVEFAPAWLLHAHARTSRYDSATVNQGQLALEHYFSNYGVTLGWRPTRAWGHTANGAELRAAWYYGEHDALTLILAGGQEAASVPGGVTLTDVRSVAVSGRHRFGRHWAASYAAGRTRQGSLYSRNGITLGAEYAF